jgi:uncharacterized membrane protein HdeD (DUF308 family)
MFEYRLSGGSKAVAIVAAILMAALGALFLIRPLGTGLALMFMATIGFIIYGITQIYLFARTPKEKRNGWVMANGIIFILFGILVLMDNVVDMTLDFAFLIGFFALFGGMTRIAMCFTSGVPEKGWLAFNGILYIIIGVFFIAAPLGSWLALDYVLGFYLIAMGVVFAAEVLTARSFKTSNKKSNKKKK